MTYAEQSSTQQENRILLATFMNHVVDTTLRHFFLGRI